MVVGWYIAIRVQRGNVTLYKKKLIIFTKGDGYDINNKRYLSGG
jgi:hypothetical protein